MFDNVRPFATWKRMCFENSKGVKKGCGQMRCFTLFPGDSDICALCINRDAIDIPHSEEYVHPEKMIEKSQESTHWAQCSACKGNYGIVGVHNLNVRPKCYYCRTNQTPPLVECCNCLNKFVNPNGSAEKALKEALQKYSCHQLQQAIHAKCFICPRCVDDPANMVVEIEVKISDIIFQNKHLVEMIPIGPYDTLMNTQISLWKRVLACKDLSLTNEIISKREICDLLYNNFRIHNSKHTSELVFKTLLDHSGIRGVQSSRITPSKPSNKLWYFSFNSKFTNFGIGKSFLPKSTSSAFL
jgi:hypothetical protein